MLSVNALQLSNFGIEELFCTKAIRASETANGEIATLNRDECAIYGNEDHSKRKLCPEEDDMARPSPPKKKKDSTASLLSRREIYRRLKKIGQEEKKWKEYGHLPRPSTKEKYIGTSQILKTALLASNLRMNEGGYTSRSSCFQHMPEIQTLKEAIDLGFILVKSENYHQPIADKLGKVIAVLAPPPNDPSYLDVTKRACDRMKKEMAKVHFDAKDLNDPKRGDGYFALNIGLSYGFGHTQPTRRRLGALQNLADALLEDLDIQRLASYQDATYALWHPKAYRYYNASLNKLWEAHPHLAGPLFPRSIMPSVAFNLGDRVVTKKHTDSTNCPFGWCTITALGDFDASKGGHIILWDLGMVLEFSAGACVCLPSALITHSNIPTGENETRMSFTQYCSGEIFRYIENGFATDKSLEKNDPAILLYRKLARKNRMKECYEMFSKVDDLMETFRTKKIEI